MEDLPLHQPSSQGAQRCWRPQLLYTALVLLVLCSCGALIFTFFPTANEPCMARFGPLPLKWQMTSPEPLCINTTSDWKLKILQNGLYLIYGEVAFDATYKGWAPFAAQLCKNERVLQTVTNSSQVQAIGGTYELRTGDTIDLIFNSEDQVLTNNTYWGIILVANLQFIS
uniref:Tumor necrosis factor ligand superfamily member 18 n=1 Tax=Jaculus jaculus TaxID=51337 RepID=A0A8C5LNZ4_JACJA